MFRFTHKSVGNTNSEDLCKYIYTSASNSHRRYIKGCV